MRRSTDDHLSGPGTGTDANPKGMANGHRHRQDLDPLAFDPSHHRLTAVLSDERNKLVAALADEIYFFHITPAGRIARLAEQVSGWGIPMLSCSPRSQLKIGITGSGWDMSLADM
jgi:hypothetical protein